jgi:hypothetical protein
VQVQQIPEWLASAVVGGVIAALGYVGKLLVESWNSYRDRQRTRRSQLGQLRSLLNVTRVSFVIQNEHAAQLLSLLEKRKTLVENSRGFEAA